MTDTSREAVRTAPMTDIDAEQAFMAAVWDALKADASDLRKQQRILAAFRDAVPALLARAEAAEAKLAIAVDALERIESITVHCGGEIHGVTAQHWQTAFDVAKDEAIIALAQIKGDE